jgi:hypothetical protein
MRELEDYERGSGGDAEREEFASIEDQVGQAGFMTIKRYGSCTPENGLRLTSTTKRCFLTV